MELKIVISDPKTGKSYQKIVKDDNAKRFVGFNVGDEIKGEIISIAGYQFKITGGSDSAGFPMRGDVQGTLRKKILAVEGTGINKKGKGLKQRKTVAGSTVYEKTSQINMKVTKYGKAPLGEEEAKEEGKEESKGEKTEEKPQEQKAEETTGKKAEKKEEKKAAAEEKAEPSKEADKS